MSQRCLLTQAAKLRELRDKLLTTKGEHGEAVLIVLTPYALLVGCAYGAYTEMLKDRATAYDSD